MWCVWDFEILWQHHKPCWASENKTDFNHRALWHWQALSRYRDSLATGDAAVTIHGNVIHVFLGVSSLRCVEVHSTGVPCTLKTTENNLIKLFTKWTLVSAMPAWVLIGIRSERQSVSTTHYCPLRPESTHWYFMVRESCRCGGFLPQRSQGTAIRPVHTWKQTSALPSPIHWIRQPQSGLKSLMPLELLLRVRWIILAGQSLQYAITEKLWRTTNYRHYHWNCSRNLYLLFWTITTR